MRWHCDICGASIEDVDLEHCAKRHCTTCDMERPAEPWGDDYDPNQKAGPEGTLVGARTPKRNET